MQPDQSPASNKKGSRRKAAVFIAAFVVLLLIASSLLVPVIVRQQVEKQVFALTGRVATLDKVSFNPFGLTLTASGFNCFEQDKKTSFFRFDSLKLSVSSSSLFRRALVVDLLQLEKPELRLVYHGTNQYNFNDILEKTASRPKEEKSSTSRFSFNNISIADGDIVFINQTTKTPVTHRVQELGLAIPFISNIPYLAEKYTDPYLHALLDGAELSFSGKAKPLAEAMEVTADIKLDKLALAQFQPYIPTQLPVKLADGQLGLDWQLTYRVHKNKKPELFINGLSRLDNFELHEKQDAALLKFQSLELLADKLEFFSQHYSFEQIALQNPELVLNRDKSGRLNLLQLSSSGEKQASSANAANAKKTDNIETFFASKELIIDNGSVKFKDQVPASGFNATLSAVNLQVAGFDTKSKDDAVFKLSVAGDKGESLTGSGSFNLAENNYKAELVLADLEIQRSWPYLQPHLTAPLNGNIRQLTTNMEYSNAGGLLLLNSALQLQNLRAAYGDDKSGITALNLDGVNYSQKENHLEIAATKLAGGTIQITRGANGKLSPMLILKRAAEHETAITDGESADEQDVDETEATQHHPEKQKPEKQNKVAADHHGFSYKIADLVLNNLAVEFKDRAIAGEPSFNLHNINLKTGNLAGPKFAAMPLDFKAVYGRRTPLALKGSLTPVPFAYKGSVDFSRLPLKDFNGYLPETVNIALLSGQLDSKSRLKVDLSEDGKLRGGFGGTVGLRRFHAVDKRTDEDLFRWESLQLDHVKGKLQPFSLDIREIALNGVYARVAIHEDGSLNLQNLVQKQTVTPTEEQAETRKAQPVQAQELKQEQTEVPKEKTVSEKGLVRIDAVTIQEGLLDFSDDHLPQPFKTRFYNLGGRVSSLSSEMNTRAEVDLRGNLENRSPLQITGTINPLRDDLFVDLTIGFKDIELAPATPYSGTYLGYAIDRGKLYLDLKYYIENKRLSAENKVLIDQFTFGDAVASDKATRLPIKLGVALLKDRNGQIKLDLPVSGRTDDPQFSVWGVVWDVLKNLFVKAVTSPFSLLSSVLGSGADDLSDITFNLGSSLLDQHEEQKLSVLAKALADRPVLKVQISGFADKEHDPEGYRNEQLLLKMRQAKLAALNKTRKRTQEKLDINQVEVLEEEKSGLLKEVYNKEKFPKPRNLLGMVKDLPDDEMRKLIFANTIVGEQELKQLAADRAVAVQQYLAANGVELQRLFLKREDIYKKPAKADSRGSRVELTPIVQ